MKNLFKTLCICISILAFTFLFSANVHLASSVVPFEYNIIPEESNNSIIDTKNQKELVFNLYESMDKIYYNDKPLEIKNNSLAIDISKLSGKTTLTFKDINDQTVSFSYYFSNKKGKVENYELVEGKNLDTYVTTFKNVKVIYSSKEKTAAKRMISHLKKLPDKLLENVDTITMIPFENTSNIAGVTKGNNITLYKFSKYSTSTQKNILYHEIAHTWASKLMEEKIIDYSYTNYSKAVKNDKNYVSTYSKSYIKEKEKYNEDFAESVAFFFMNEKSFKKKYPYRFEYINNLLTLKTEENKEKNDD